MQLAGIGQAVMPHGTLNMSRVQGPTELLGSSIGAVDLGMDMLKLDFLGTPFLNSKELDIHVTRSCPWLRVINHIDDRLVVFMDDGRPS